MKRRWMVVLGAVALAWMLWTPSKGGKAPDQKLVGHFDDICRIAKNNVEHPDRGVKRLFGYLGKNSPHMMEEYGDLLVLIERIDDDRKHDARARQAAKRFQRSFIRCARHYEAFFTAVENDPAASARFERGVTRFARTLEILFGGEGASLLPPELAERFFAAAAK